VGDSVIETLGAIVVGDSVVDPVGAIVVGDSVVDPVGAIVVLIGVNDGLSEPNGVGATVFTGGDGGIVNAVGAFVGIGVVAVGAVVSTGAGTGCIESANGVGDDVTANGTRDGKSDGIVPLLAGEGALVVGNTVSGSIVDDGEDVTLGLATGDLVLLMGAAGTGTTVGGFTIGEALG
jgi:hypothetical protein